ncbi:MAG: hypothetical protein ACJ8FZ_17355 [Bradyrhizobium sp.]
MKKLIASAAALTGVLVSTASMPTPALAQAGNFTLVVYGSDPCPREAICIRKGESERYRLPPSQNPQGTPQQRTSWAQKSKVLTTVGATGVGSCSAVGPGGREGCLVQSINQAKSQTRQTAEDNQPPQ